MDLPTYTNIWRIEKRLYKLYDFRLPMPLPINWIAVFAGITVPYIVLLIAIGLPFSHTLLWLYVLPPGVLTWLTTRPVIEGKRLPELVESQVRYLTEPRTWVRLTPLAEKDQMVLSASAWRGRQASERAAAAMAAVAMAAAAEAATSASPAVAGAAGTAMARRGRAKTRVPAVALSAPPAPIPVCDHERPARRAPRPVTGQVVTAGSTVRPRVLALGPGGAARPIPALPPARNTPHPPASQPAPARPPVIPAVIEGVPVRAWGGPAHLEVSHDRPGHRPAAAEPSAPPSPPRAAESRPATTLPTGDVGRTWPSPARPLRPIRETQAPAEQAPAEQAPAETAPTAAAFVEDAPVQDAPVQEAAVQDAPVQEAAVQRAPAHDASAEVGSDQGVPVEDTPAETAPVKPAAPPVAVQETQNRSVPSVERALSGPAREQNPSWHGKVKIVTGAGTSHGPGARDQEALDRNRARLDVPEPRRILVLGCTGGAGQTVTALMTGYMLASLREHPVAVVDLHDGTLARYRAPAAWLDEILAGRPPQAVTSSRPDGLHPTPKPSPARLDVIASHQQPRDGDEIKLAVQLNRHYPLTVLDPGPSFLTRLLKVTDQLVVVVPANAEAAGALADTRDWLDNNGHAELAMQSVTVINGVSRRSLPDVENAESIARGRSRAIVRIPWDDMLPVAAAGPSTLRPQTRVAYTALAGVLVAGLAGAGVRKKQ